MLYEFNNIILHNYLSANKSIACVHNIAYQRILDEKITLVIRTLSTYLSNRYTYQKILRKPNMLIYLYSFLNAIDGISC